MAKSTQMDNHSHVATGFEQVDEDESISITTSYATVFTIDSRIIKDSIINFYNADATATMSFKIYGSAAGFDVIPADNHTSWFNILNTATNLTPSTYDHNKEAGILPQTPWYESFSNNWG